VLGFEPSQADFPFCFGVFLCAASLPEKLQEGSMEGYVQIWGLVCPYALRSLLHSQPIVVLICYPISVLRVGDQVNGFVFLLLR